MSHLLHDYFMFLVGALFGGGLFYDMTWRDWRDWLDTRFRHYWDR